jgi:hypothetical protein
MRNARFALSILAIAAIVCSTTSIALATPTEAKLRWHTTVKGGFGASVEYTGTLTEECTATLLARYQYGTGKNQVTRPSVARTIRARSVTSSKIRFRLKAGKKLPALYKRRDTYPIIHLMVRTVCGDTTIDSNVFARRVRCGQSAADIMGYNKDRVSASTWLRRLTLILK